MYIKLSFINQYEYRFRKVHLKSGLEKEPVDPFTGEPFIYKLQEDGSVVYSVGSNEKDDEGRATFQVTKIVTEKDDDWPWREKAK